MDQPELDEEPGASSPGVSGEGNPDVPEAEPWLAKGARSSMPIAEFSIQAVNAQYLGIIIQRAISNSYSMKGANNARFCWRHLCPWNARSASCWAGYQ